MTTIAWDGTTLAADRCSWSGGVRRGVRKVFKVTAPGGSRYLVAFAGDGSFAMAVLAWMRGGRRPDPLGFLTQNELGNQCCLAIDERRRCWSLSNNLFWHPMRERIFAFGAGQEFAWGALEAGASARRAIEITAKRSDYAALGVDCVRF